MKVRGCCHQIKQKALKCSGVAVLIPQPDFQISPPLKDPSSRILKSFNQAQKSEEQTRLLDNKINVFPLTTLLRLHGSLASS